jgi:hypothetical protein
MGFPPKLRAKSLIHAQNGIMETLLQRPIGIFLD